MKSGMQFWQPSTQSFFIPFPATATTFGNAFSGAATSPNLICFGPGSCPDKRVTWARELIDEEADQFLMHSFIDPNSERPWLSQRMALRVPFSA
ncbi:hypothetical protein L1987_18682 [Smallanthus sonchifolius]|uniref:Uncharacterized protein n=1 Tax=Smallanthus sonchifolius TaxID=185202 RepID=A0ACB9J1G2_9ASTR|nr:hypothetical protein L1987_18682 [Smallanthus sonchifolius]